MERREVPLLRPLLTGRLL
jgi:hypothetical protein